MAESLRKITECNGTTRASLLWEILKMIMIAAFTFTLDSLFCIVLDFWCMWDRNESFSYTMVIGGVLLLPLPLTIACFVLIFREIFKHKKSVCYFKDGRGSVQHRAFKESMRASRTLLVGFITFLVLWAPAGVLVLLDFSDTVGMQTYLFTVMLAHFHSCADFLINLIVDRKFRRHLVNFLSTGRIRSETSLSVSAKISALKTTKGTTRTEKAFIAKRKTST